MKKLLFFFVLFIFGTHCNAQIDDEGVETFNIALEHYENDNLDSAIFIWTEIVNNEIGLNTYVYSHSFYNIPTVYWHMKEYEKAIEWFKKVLDSDLQDNDQTGSIMEPHANYKHKSALSLAALYEIDSNYTEVLHWLNLADTVYRYWGFVGSATSITKQQAQLLEWKTEVLIEMNKVDEAIRMIITELICAESYIYTYFRISESLLFSLIDTSDFKKEFDVALENITITELDENNWNINFMLQGLPYYIPVSNDYSDFYIPHYWKRYFIKKDTKPDKESVIEHITSKNFYKELSKDE